MKKVIKKKNRTFKSANNHKIQNYHKMFGNNHIVKWEPKEVYSQLASIYQELDDDFCQTDLIDLEFYERWLNG